MVYAGKPTGRALSTPKGLAVGVLCALGWTVMGACITGALIHYECVSEDVVGYGAVITLISGAYLAAKLAYAKIKRRRGYVMGLSGLCYYMCLLGMNALFFGGQYAGLAVTAAAIAAGTLSALVLGAGKRRRSSFRKHTI